MPETQVGIGAVFSLSRKISSVFCKYAKYTCLYVRDERKFSANGVDNGPLQNNDSPMMLNVCTMYVQCT